MPQLALIELRELLFKACCQRLVACILAKQVHDVRVCSAIQQKPYLLSEVILDAQVKSCESIGVDEVDIATSV